MFVCVCFSGYLKLSSLYRIEKRPAMKGKPFVCEIVSESVQLVLASEDEKMFHLFVFFLQTQTKIKDELEGKGYKSFCSFLSYRPPPCSNGTAFVSIGSTLQFSAMNSVFS